MWHVDVVAGTLDTKGWLHMTLSQCSCGTIKGSISYLKFILSLIALNGSIF